jgi:prepilin-type processing-associated H-X9-DG protein
LPILKSGAVQLLSVEASFTVLFGWIGYLHRVLPQMEVDWPSVAVAGTALILFTGGVHWLGRAWRRRLAVQDPARSVWKTRLSLATVAVVFLLFAAGIFMIGITHQTGWLLNSEEPLTGEALKLHRGSSSEQNLRDIGMGMKNYLGTMGTYPAGGTFKPDGTMLHSWETELLAYMWYSPKGIDFDRPWNDSHNQKHFKCIIPNFINPGFRVPHLVDEEGYGLSHFAANARVLAGNKAAKITKGSSTTLLIGELNANFKPWGHSVNWRDPGRGINGSPYGYGGPRNQGGAHFLMADGSVRFLSDQVSPSVLRALANPNRAEEIDPDVLEEPR